MLLSDVARGQQELYAANPPFISQGLPPNVMMLVDNSTSMSRFAYFDGWSTATSADDNWGLLEATPCTGFIPDRRYYGYFDPGSWYLYVTNHFVFQAKKADRGKNATEWDGNFLNWLTMRRTDVLRKVLVGGIMGGGDLVGQDPVGTIDECGGWKGIRASTAANFMPAARVAAVSDKSPELIRFKVWEQGNTAAIKEIAGVNYETGQETKVAVTLNISCYVGTQPLGVVQRVGDRVRWGIAFFEQDGQDGSDVKASIAGTSMSAVYNEIENTLPAESHTPLGESLWSLAGYFAQVDTHPDFPSGPGPNYGSSYTVNFNADPLNYNGEIAWCGKSFIIMITDGEPCGDGNLPAGLANYASGRSDYNCDYTTGEGTDCYIPPCSPGGNVPGVEDVALYAHTNDLRPGLDTEQTLDLYVVFAFGTGSQILRYAAINGGFTDKNGSGSPDLQDEWDENGDGEPDNYFEGDDGYGLEAALMMAITDILRKAASGTSVSVLATSASGEGSLFQAFFRPSVTEGTRQINWLGYLHGLWVDAYGHIREDTTDDHRLVYSQDKIIEFAIGGSGDTMVERYVDNDGNGFPDSTVPEATVPLSELEPIWGAGTLLAERAHGDRTIKAFVDSDKDGLVDSGEFISFSQSNAATLRPYLRAADNAEAENIINFVRGEQISGYRDRELTVDGTTRVWKLGDIVYSTPSVVGRPNSNFHFIYSDETYAAYYNQYKDRDTVVFIGANDGMLHAFWAGKYKEGDDGATADAEERGWFSDESALASNLGDELWGYIPYNLLPHLKWLTASNYAHMYFVDLKPLIADVKIFPDDDDHPNGWGTILIGGMRLGGGKIDVTDDFGVGTATRTFRSAYFAMDVTVPESPTLLWEFTDAELGFTTSYPTIAKIGNTYFLVFGSGPTTYYGTSNQQARVYVMDLLTGGKTLYREITTGSNAFMSAPIAVDIKMDYNTDVLYIGESTATAGKVFRLCTKVNGAYSSNPATWTLSTLFVTDNNQPVTASPAASYGAPYDIWVFFGTGRYLSNGDREISFPTTTALQTFYGMKDLCADGTCTTTVVKADDLYDASDIVVNEDGSVSGLGSGADWDAVEDNAENYTGWYVDMEADGSNPSERVIHKAALLGGIVFFTAFTPNSDICGFGGDGVLYALNYETGTANKEQVIGTLNSEILKSTDIGFGLPSQIAIHVGQEAAGATGYVQQSTGMIQRLELNVGDEIRSSITSWRELK